MSIEKKDLFIDQDLNSNSHKNLKLKVDYSSN